MYLLSLIEGRQVHLNGKKVIKKEAFEKMLHLDEIIEEGKKELEALKESLKKKGDKAARAGRKKGFEEGLAEWNDQLLLFEQNLNMLRYEMQQSLLPLVLKTTKKIIGEQLRLSPDTVVDIVMQAVRSILQCRRVKIYLHREDREMVEKEKEKIKDLFEQLEMLEIAEREDVDRGGCILETERGIVNATLENQFRSLENAFEAHMKG